MKYIADSSRYPSITVDTALKLPALRAALPRVVAGAASLQRSIRWVHASDLPDITPFLRGGELILTSGSGIGERRPEQRQFVTRLAEAGAAGLVIELGTRFAAGLPPGIVEAADESGLPLVELHASTAFVDVTESIHTQIVNHQFELLQRAEQLQHDFTSAMLDGGSIPAVLSVLADAVGNPVFLDDDTGRLLGYGAPSDVQSTDEVLRAWTEARHHADHVGLTARVPTQASGGSGRIVLLPLLCPVSSFAPLALNRAAQIVALALLRSRQEEELLALGRGDLLSGLASGRFDATFAVARAQEMGFDDRNVVALLPVAARLVASEDAQAFRGSAAHVEIDRWITSLRDLESRVSTLSVPTLIGVDSVRGDLLLVLGLRSSSDREQLADRVAALLRDVAAHRGSSEIVVAVGAASEWATLGEGLREATEATAVAALMPSRAWYDAAAMPLDRLLWRLNDNEDLRRYAERMLGPLLAHDAKSKNALLPTLATLCGNGGRRAETARALYLNRQALYDRIARIERVLGTDLSDWDTLLALYLAIRIRATSPHAPAR
ncbi:PucR family transcriptional regulator [Okibacterium endophyticum]